MTPPVSAPAPVTQTASAAESAQEAGPAASPSPVSQRVALRIPAPLRSRTGGQSMLHVEVVGEVTVAAVFAAVRLTHPGIYDAVLDERGHVRPHCNVFVGPENIRFTNGLATPVTEGVEVWILPAVSGG